MKFLWTIFLSCQFFKAYWCDSIIFFYICRIKTLFHSLLEIITSGRGTNDIHVNWATWFHVHCVWIFVCRPLRPRVSARGRTARTRSLVTWHCGDYIWCRPGPSRSWNWSVHNIKVSFISSLVCIEWNLNT